jgi:hypothetical protein
MTGPTPQRHGPHGDAKELAADEARIERAYLGR